MEVQVLSSAPPTPHQLTPSPITDSLAQPMLPNPVDITSDTDPALNPGTAKPTPAPDPTATIEEDNPSPDLLSSSQIPKLLTLTSLRSYTPKFYFLKIVSLILIIHGLHNLYQNLVALFVVFPQLPSVYKMLNFSEDIYSAIFYEFILITTTGAIETIIGVSLALKHSGLIKNLHIIVGLLIFLFSYTLHQIISPINLEHLTDTSAIAQHNLQNRSD